MFTRRTKISTYTLRLSSPRITPSNNLSDFERNNKTINSGKTVRRWSPKKIKYYAVAIAGGLTIAIVIVIAILVPLAGTSKSSTTQKSLTASIVTAITNISITPTNSITSTPSMTASTTTATSESTTTTSETTTTTTSQSTATTSETTTTTTSESTTTTTDSTTSTSATTSTSSTTDTTTTTALPLRWNSTAMVVAGTGVPGIAANQLKSPTGLAFDSSNSLYIVDFHNNRVQKYLTGASSGFTVAGLANGRKGSSPSQLHYPKSVIVDTNDNMFITDVYNHRVQMWNNSASYGVTVAGNGTAGNALNLLFRPNYLTIDQTSGILYIADTNNHRVMRYLPGARSGTMIAGGNGPGLKNTQLYFPTGIYFDSSSNSLIIASWGNNNVVRWILGASSWTLLAGSIRGTCGNTATLLCRPESVLLDSLGNLYVCDQVNHRVQFFRAGRTNATTIAGIHSTSSNNATRLRSPFGLALDKQLNLYVADVGSNQVLKFVRL